MESSSSFQLELLPAVTIELIISYLPLGMVGTTISMLSHSLQELSNRIVRTSFVALDKLTVQELKKLKSEILSKPLTDEFISDRILLLRFHFTLELLLEEVVLLKALFRNLILKTKHVYTIGPLVEVFYDVFYTARKRSLPAWQFNDPLTSNMLSITKKLIDSRLSQEIEREDFQLGTHVVDIMNTVINKKYSFSAQIIPETNTCHLTGDFHVRNPQYLNRPPRWADQGQRVPDKEDTKRLFNFLINIVRINNRVLLREEQHYRELETMSSGLGRHGDPQNSMLMYVPNLGTRWLDKEVRSYDEPMNCTKRELMKDRGLIEIKEECASTEDEPEDVSRKV